MPEGFSHCYPFSTAHSCILGYFLRHEADRGAGGLQLIEQICRVSAIYMLSVSVFTGNEAGAVMAVWGMVAGDGISCIYTLVSYKFHVYRLQRHLSERHGRTADRRTLFGQLMGDAFLLL